MATKAELEEALAAAEEKVEVLEAQKAELVALLEAARASKAGPPAVPGTCINCGQGRQPIEARPGEEGEGMIYYCPVCRHRWDDEEERSPFRWERR